MIDDQIGPEREAAEQLREYLVRTGDFGTPVRSTAVATFQARMGMGSDAIGIVGPKTRALAASLGVTLPTATTMLPPEPLLSPPRVLSRIERELKFGVVDFTWDPQPGNPEHIKVPKDWGVKHLMVIALEHPVRGQVHLTVNRAAEQAFLDLWDAWSEQNVLADVLDIQTYAPRFKRTLGTEDQRHQHCALVSSYPNAADYLSTHSWAAAGDVNSAYNFQGNAPVPVGQKGSVLRLVGPADKVRFAWGGRFHTIDAEHFEVGI